MDDGEIELSVFLPNSSSSNTFIRGSTSVDSYIDDFLKHNRICTHTHTCNPPGPDVAHSHTCHHAHTRVLSSGEDSKTHLDTPSSKPRGPSSNREAVRRYREKKKAHTAYLEEEIKKLHLFNQQLVRRLQRQEILEAEILRLRTLLSDLRAKIDSAFGSFPNQKYSGFNSDMSFKEDDCEIHSASTIEAIGLQCQPMPVDNGEIDAKAVISWQGNCQPAFVDCCMMGNQMEDGLDCRVEALKTLV